MTAQSTIAVWPTVDELAQQIRRLNGSGKKGAGALAEDLLDWMQSRNAGACLQPLAEVAEQLRKMMTDQGTVNAVALDIARWFVNGDRPDEFKLKEWAERLDRDAVAKAYEDGVNK